MTGAWKLLEYLPRRKPADSERPDFLGLIIPLCEPRAIPEGARVHVTVPERPERPVNLPMSFETEGEPELDQ